jgi:Protein of unknown function (DUF5672)
MLRIERIAMEAKKKAIVIPIYKATPSESEIASLRQAVSILSAYQVLFICAEQFNPEVYIQILELSKAHTSNYNFIRFDDRYFSSIAGYNRLLISYSFYRKFKAYDYILIYQLDAWVFRDELEYWCSQGYDYIGAPWFEGYHNAVSDSNFLGVGNGGFSLRKVSSCLKVLKSFRYLVSPTVLFRHLKNNINYINLKAFLQKLTVTNNTFYRFNDFKENEDVFWSQIVPKRFKWYELPGLDVAMKFSMEVNARTLYAANNNVLPFGCHRWEKYDPEFWKPFIGA